MLMSSPKSPLRRKEDKKTEEISLSLMFKDEKSYDDLLDVLNDLTNILEKWYDSPDFPSSFVCGDQLTVERIASLIRILDEDGEEVDQLSKLIPAATDWHTRLNYVDWIWMLLYKPNDVHKPGSWAHLATCLGYKNLPTKGKKDFNRAEDFVETITEAHIIGHVMELLRIANLQALPDNFPENSSIEEKKAWIENNFGIFVDSRIWFKFEQESENDEENDDQRYFHSLLTMSLGVIDMLFHQVCKEANGDLIIPIYKLLTGLFHYAHRTKYAFEGIRLLTDYYFRLTEFHAFILIWNRSSNPRGGKDHNKPLDLRIEHLNRLLRSILKRLGSNLGQETITKVTQAAPVLEEIRRNYQESMGKDRANSKKQKPSNHRDVIKIYRKLKTLQTFTVVPGREFITVPNNPLARLDRDKFNTMVDRNARRTNRVR